MATHLPRIPRTERFTNRRRSRRRLEGRVIARTEGNLHESVSLKSEIKYTYSGVVKGMIN